MNTSGSAVGRPFSGSRAWRCRIDAPASAAAIASAAIWSGVTGRYGLIVGVCTEPVTAQVMTTFFSRHAARPSAVDRQAEFAGQRFQRVRQDRHDLADLFLRHDQRRADHEIVALRSAAYAPRIDDQSRARRRGRSAGRSRSPRAAAASWRPDRHRSPRRAAGPCRAHPPRRGSARTVFPVRPSAPRPSSRHCRSGRAGRFPDSTATPAAQETGLPP